MSHFRRQCQFRLVKKFGQEIGHEIGAEWSRSTKRPLQYCWRYKNNVTALASTSSRISVGTDSTLLPPRAPRSSTRGWSQRTTPLVFIPVSGTAKPIRRANSPPLVMGRIIGSLVAWLNAVGEMTRTGRRPRCSCPWVGSSDTMKISPRLIATRRPRTAHQPTAALLPAVAWNSQRRPATPPGYSEA